MSEPGPLVTLSRREDGVAVIRLDRPKVNALSAALLDQLAAAVEDLSADLPRAVVVYGGDRVFSAGADIAEFRGAGAGGTTAGRFHTALNALAELPRATIAAICGYALGGGCELALACDFRVAGEGARLGQPEILLGIIPGGGATQRLPRLIGLARAKDLILSGRHVAAGEARAIGLVDEVVPDASVLERALSLASELGRGAVVAQGLAKRAIEASLTSPLPEGLALERQLFGEAFRTEDAAIGIRSFREQGPGRARFVGR
jgi:enoyl-CoA hydratase/carnithine racemase